jgi:3'-5' exonuclease
MGLRKVVVDIETIPCVDALRPFIPPPRPSAQAPLWRRWFKRKATYAEESYLQTALNWTLGRIICIGLLVEGNNHTAEEHAFIAPIQPGDSLEDSLQKEAEALRQFWGFVCADDYFIGHNILGFDLPFLWNRSLICGVCPSRPLHLQRESSKFTFDTMQIWAHWASTPSSRQFVKLNTLAQVMGLQAKTGSGSHVYDWWREQQFEKIRSYCLSDVRLEYNLYRRMTLHGSTPALQWSHYDDR